METFQVYPGARFFNARREHVAGGDALVATPRRAAGHDAEGDMRAAFYMACDHDGCEHVLDAKAIHGDDADPGLKLIRPRVVGEIEDGEAVTADVGTSRRQRSRATARQTRQTEKSHD
jgi:hypothetical protein